MGSASFKELYNNRLIWLAEGSSNSLGFSQKVENSIPFGIPEVDRILPQGGLPHGSINEWGCQDDLIPYSFLTLLASEQIKRYDKYVVWIEDKTRPLPHFLLDTSSSPAILSKSYFIKSRSERERIWLLDETSKTKGIGLIIANMPALSPPALKKLSLAIRDSGSVLLLMKESKRKVKSPIALSRWEVYFSPSDDTYPQYLLKLASYKGIAAERLEWVVKFKGSIIEARDLSSRVALGEIESSGIRRSGSHG